MPTMSGPGSMRYGGLENAASGLGIACSNRFSAACSGQRGSNGASCQRSSSARPPLPSGSCRRPLSALVDITNTTGEQQLPGQPDPPMDDGEEDLAALVAAFSDVEIAAAPRMRSRETASKERRDAPAPTQAPEEPAVFSQVFFADSVDEYISDISEHLFRNEEKSLPRQDYMDSQPEISANMRSVLIDWLVEVHMKHHLCLETLHLSVNIIDRYLSKQPATRKSLQLVGIVGMLIASKFEEINPPELDFWVYITANAYTQEDVIKMECNVLATLGFQIMVPTAAHFLPILQRANGCDGMHCALVEYIVELSMLDTRMLCYPPSHVVSAALLLSNELLVRQQIWPPAMVQLSRRPARSLRGCAQVMRDLFELDRACLEGRPRALNKKFSSEKRHSVATMQF